MSKIKRCLDTIQDAKVEIFSALGAGGSSMYFDIEDNLKAPWYLENGTLSYLSGGDLYSYEYASEVGESVEGEVMYYIQENGDTFYTIVSREYQSSGEEEFYEMLEANGIEY